MDHWCPASRTEPAGICRSSIFSAEQSFPTPFSSRVVRGSYFVHLTRMDRHNFSANSSIPGRSARKRAWQNTEGGYALARLVCPGRRVSMFLCARGRIAMDHFRFLNEDVSHGYGFSEPRVWETQIIKIYMISVNRIVLQLHWKKKY